MKHLQIIATLLLTQSFCAGLAAAAAPEAIQAVLASDALKEISGHADITNVREDAVYRCPGCYSLELSLGRGDEAKKVLFFTSAHLVDGKWEYSVKAKEEPKSAGRCIAMGRVGGEDKACAKHADQNSCESKDKWEWCSWQSR